MPGDLPKAIRTSDAIFENGVPVDFHKSRALALAVNLMGIILFVPFYLIFSYIALRLFTTGQADLFLYHREFADASGGQTALFLVAVLIVVALHEGIHGLCFFLCTGERPVFGFKSVFFYAGAPGWYIRRDCYLIVVLSPLVLITIIGFTLLSFVPESLASLVLLAFTANAAGASGDLWVAMKLLRTPRRTYVHDTGIVSTICF